VQHLPYFSEAATLWYLTAFGVGVVTALASALLWVMIIFVLPIAVPFLRSRVGGAGVGASAATITSSSVLTAAVIGFIGGVARVMWRRGQ
jgi:hypothetical protein